ncbi:MAG: zinc-binding alcohol dehydrogenase [Anaerolineae bacterium]
MKRLALYFTAPRRVALREEHLPAPGAGQMLVQMLLSAISSGTEMLIYRGEAPADLPADTTITALGGSLRFPLKYGYSLVGRVIETGQGVDDAWVGRLVFAFHPHETAFLAGPDELIPVPEGLSPEDAITMPNMETAITLVHDGQPMLGEQVLVMGQGIVGLLTTSLLTRFPLHRLITVDRWPHRREVSLALGAAASFAPEDEASIAALLADQREYPAADLSYELSGSPAALDQAIRLTGFSGRVVIGSWYGTKPASLDLGGRFHRSRIRLISSQVSSIDPALTGRWTKERRWQQAWEQIRRAEPARFITHRIPFDRAPEAYALLDDDPGSAIQVVLTYP